MEFILSKHLKNKLIIVSEYLPLLSLDKNILILKKKLDTIEYVSKN
jgi:hypothetical protein